MTNAHVTSLMTDEITGAVSGVRYRQGEGEEEGETELPAAAVVLTTGGKFWFVFGVACVGLVWFTLVCFGFSLR